MKTDVLIIGGGLTGIAAAHEIVKNTALQVDLLHCGGGASPYIHGFCIPVGEGTAGNCFLKIPWPPAMARATPGWPGPSAKTAKV